MARWDDLFSKETMKTRVFDALKVSEFAVYKEALLAELTDEQVKEIVDVIDYHDSRLVDFSHDEAIGWQKAEEPK